jgi:restriction system protein
MQSLFVVEANMARRNESLLVVLAHAPWWMSVTVAAIVFITMKLILPVVLVSPVFSGMAKLSSSSALLVASIFLIPGFVSLFNAWQKGELFKNQTGLSSIRKLSWREFEVVIGEAYRKQGYTVAENAGPGADGGIDLLARKEGETVLVQCKHWKAQKVGVATVREMFGLLNDKKANEVHIITSGDFTDEARGFAQGKPIKLVDGISLTQLINKYQAATPRAEKEPEETRALCPRCGSNMVMRTVKKGPHQGNQFWGCERFPRCMGTRPMQNP